MTRVTSPLSERSFSRAFTRTMSLASAPLRSLRATSTGRRSSTKSGSATEYFPRRTSIAGSIKRALRSEVSGKAQLESTMQLRRACQHAQVLNLLEKSCYGEEATDHADGYSYSDEEEQGREGVYCVAGNRHVGEGVVRPVDEEEVDPDHGERREASSGEGLQKTLEDEWRAHEAVRGADQLHHLYLLAPGEDGEPDGVGDQEYAGDEEQERGPVEAPDHVRSYRVETVDGLLGVAQVSLREPPFLQPLGHGAGALWVLELDLDGRREDTCFQVLVQVGLVLELILELGERLLFGDPGRDGDFGPGFDFVREGVDLLTCGVRHECLDADVLAHGAYYALDVGADEQSESEDQDTDERGGDGGDAHEQIQAEVLEGLGQKVCQIKPHRRTPPLPCHGLYAPPPGRLPACALRPPSPCRGSRPRWLCLRG